MVGICTRRDSGAVSSDTGNQEVERNGECSVAAEREREGQGQEGLGVTVQSRSGRCACRATMEQSKGLSRLHFNQIALPRRLHRAERGLERAAVAGSPTLRERPPGP